MHMQEVIDAPRIRYTFYFDGEEPLVFNVTHGEDASSSVDRENDIPPWALLDHCRCSHCSLPPEEGKSCPAAMSLFPVIKTFGKSASFEEVTVCVEMDGKETSFIKDIGKAGIPLSFKSRMNPGCAASTLQLSLY